MQVTDIKKITGHKCKRSLPYLLNYVMIYNIQKVCFRILQETPLIPDIWKETFIQSVKTSPAELYSEDKVQQTEVLLTISHINAVQFFVD